MKRPILGKACIGVASALFALYLVVITIRIKNADDFILIPYPWVWWLVIPFVVLAVLGVILTDWKPKTGSPPSTAAVDPAPTTGPTYNTTINGPANIAQGSNGVEQTNTSAPNTSAPSTPASSSGSVHGPWTDHVGLRCHIRITSSVRPVVWISNGASAGELRPATQGPKWEVYSSTGEFLGEADDVKPGMEILRDHES